MNWWRSWKSPQWGLDINKGICLYHPNPYGLLTSQMHSSVWWQEENSLLLMLIRPSGKSWRAFALPSVASDGAGLPRIGCMSYHPVPQRKRSDWVRNRVPNRTVWLSLRAWCQSWSFHPPDGRKWGKQKCPFPETDSCPCPGDPCFLLLNSAKKFYHTGMDFKKNSKSGSREMAQ